MNNIIKNRLCEMHIVKESKIVEKEYIYEIMRKNCNFLQIYWWKNIQESLNQND